MFPRDRAGRSSLTNEKTVLTKHTGERKKGTVEKEKKKRKRIELCSEASDRH